jgi:hypothetical protein
MAKLNVFVTGYELILRFRATSVAPEEAVVSNLLVKQTN